MPQGENQIKTSKKPNLRQGQPLPLKELSPDSFEDFTHKLLIELGKTQEFEITGGPQNSSDHGFDLVGRRISDNNLMCIQCKRYNSSSIGLPVVAEELAKVAINSKLEDSCVKEHYILTTGSITKDLNSKLRSNKRNEILKISLEKLGNDSLKSILKKCTDKKLDPKEIVKDYIDNLDKIVVWSGRDIENNAGTIWSTIEESVEKHFKLDRVLSEYPRPNFNCKEYINEVATDDDNLLELIATPSEFPPNICKVDPDRFNWQSIEELDSDSQGPLAVDELLSSVSCGSSLLLIGQGGSGKTTTLIHFRDVLATRYENTENCEVPVYVKLAGFRTDLDQLIHDALGITHGHWSSLPFGLFLLLDGMDEISSDDISLFSQQLTRILKRNNVKAIISLRAAGLQLPAFLPAVSSCYSLKRLDFRQIIKFTELFLSKDDSERFIDILICRANSLGAETFTLPFGLITALDYFQTHKELPDSLYEIIFDTIERRIKRNKSRRSSIDPAINTISESTVIALAESLAFEVRVVRKKAALYREEAEAAVVSALQRIKDKNVFGASNLADETAFLISVHYEMQRVNSSGLYVLDHDLVSDCLASRTLAINWKGYIESAGDKVGWDAWTFASCFVPDGEQCEFVQKMICKDLALAARCCREMGGVNEENVQNEIVLYSNDPSLGIFVTAMHAASILRSPETINLLNRCLGERDPHRNYNAKRFLARSGDEKFLKAILDENERMKAGGLNPSGGTFNMWFEAPIEISTKIAREQIDQYLLGRVPYIPIALETLELYGNNSDLERVKSAFYKTENPTEFYVSSRCLLLLDEELAADMLRLRAKDIEGDEFWLHAMKVLNAHNYSFDAGPVFEMFVAKSCLESHEEIAGFGDIAKVLGENILPEDTDITLMNLLDVLDVDKNEYSYIHQFYNVWEVATSHEYKRFEKKALEYLCDGSIPEVIVGLNYGRRAFSEGLKKGEFIKKCLGQLDFRVSEDEPQFSIIKILFEILIEFGEKGAVVVSAEKVLSDHTSKYYEAVKEKNSDKKGDLYHRYEYAYPEMLVALSGIRNEIDSGLLLDLVGVDVSHRSEEIKMAYKDIMEILPREAVERRISKIEDNFAKVESLRLLLHLEKSSSTQELFVRNIPLLLTHHIFYKTLEEFSLVYWSVEAKETLVENVSKLPWDQEEVLFQSFQGVMDKISHLFDQHDIDELLSPVMNSTENQHTKYLMNLWVDFVRRSTKFSR